MPRRLKITLAYDGTDFHGWQIQPGLPTIQGKLEEIVSAIEDRPVSVAGSGRTDAGVHARAQVAAFTLDNPIPAPNLQRAMNRLLPPAIRILSAEETGLEFHPRFDAVAKTYEYRIARSEVCSPFDWKFVHHFPYALNVIEIEDVVSALEGEHDFAAFASSDDSDAFGKSKVRRIFSSRIELDSDRLIYRVRGSGFLKHMVRNIVGTLIEVGKENIDREGLLELLAGGNMTKAGPTVPAKGLTLMCVEYGRSSYEHPKI